MNAQPAAWSPPPPKVATGKWYFVITIATAGLLAAVPFFHAASRLDRPQLRKVGAGMAAGALLGYALIAVAPTDDAGDPTGWLSNVAGIILLTVVVVATILLIGLRKEVYNPSGAALPPSGNQGAMASIEAARRKRKEARELAVKDPMMARELGIGRPESRQGYDDGGLLDLNLATATQLSEVCGIPQDLAQEVVTSRDALGRFLNVEDAIVYGQIAEEYAPLVRDRGIIVTDR
jgi:Helix-hairpin-helix motif